MTGTRLLRKLRLGEVTPSVKDEMRGAVLRGDCPFCGRTGFRCIASHCQKAHEVKSRELRDLLGITWVASICSEELHNKLRELHKDKTPSALGKPDGPRRLSIQGRANISASAAKWSVNVPREVKAAAGRKGGRKNKGRVASNRDDTHGRRAMFRRGCRCELCDAANKAYWRDLNKRRSRRQNDNASVD